MARLSFSLCIRSLVPAVPRECLCPTHAPSTPVAARPIRHPADLSQDDETVLVSSGDEYSLIVGIENCLVGAAAASSGTRPGTGGF
ncbi:MAG: hypothetical protein E5Y50_33990, partial [Mesorhizobium sp.]